MGKLRNGVGLKKNRGIRKKSFRNFLFLNENVYIALVLEKDSFKPEVYGQYE
jgi:hypothetical protein